MDSSAPAEVTQLLIAWSNGDQAARERLMALVYEELHRLARRYMRNESPGHTLQTSALVNEAFIRLVDQRNVHWQNRSHFFAIASRAMRQILVDHARRRGAGKRGSGAIDVSLTEAVIPAQTKDSDLLALDEALSKLAAFDARKCQVVEMRYFGGCTVEETAEALGVSTITVIRETRVAEAWLRRAMLGEQ